MSKRHYNVIIIGAGLSGIGTACRLADESPDKSMAILERRERIGGTWDLFRYPGIRSDSDILTFGYSFKPWNGSTTLADGGSIREYIQQTAHEYGIKDKVHFGLKITNANWSSEDRCWTITALKERTNETVTYSCDFLVGCTGYYNYDEGFRPEFPGEKDFEGTIVHPQHWPENLDYAGKKVVVIGSGATSVTLVPSMAGKAKHVTMLQRSPSYIFSIPAKDPITNVLQRLLPARWAFKLARQRNIISQRIQYLACRKWPNLMRRYLLSHVRKHVGPSIDMENFSPKYMPWDERVCAVPDADLFKALRTGTASIETDHIDRFTANGILLKSGKTLEADIIVTATGLNLQLLGGMELTIDGKAESLSDKMAYKGLLIENIPNMAWLFGYVNASWTLKVNIAGDYLGRLFKFMKERNLDVVVPKDNGQNKLEEGILDTLSSGYVKRSRNNLPRQGKAYPWRTTMSYGYDKKMLTEDPIEDQFLTFPASNPKKASMVKGKSKAA
ncbi:MAG: NAD(P)/FAD-dependent oxidoreductase [Alcanivorax sp.]|uniref:flavin-containing monooxygenase n=1 Tax=Alcanivorax sp. TaxID=1872427 RepID=UPI0026379F5F|nr:NAD(P)/FAD-dependent oxidoreductase [Alcanivorax sp.]MDF1723484.1 NAD(P)/FAD-dependent oxidoreductase [Alcanivorax sp.]